MADSFQIGCMNCKTIVGSVKEILDIARGVYTNQCDPNPMPKTCQCGAVLTRIE